MRGIKRFAAIMAVLAAGLLAGCAAAGQPDDMAYVITMGVDRTAAGEVEISAQVPSIAEESEAQKYLFMSASGATFPEALDVLEASSQRRLNLTQMKTILFSAETAGEEGFWELLTDILYTEQIFGDACLVVTLNPAKELLQAQKAVIGMRLCHSVEAAIRHYQEHGYAPVSTLADVYYRMNAYTSDPVGILAATSDGEDFRAVAPDALGAAWPGALPRTGENANEYVGCALFAAGRMVGMLDGREEELRGTLSGEVHSLDWSQGGRNARLQVKKRALRVDISGERPVIGIELGLEMEARSRTPDAQALAESVAGAIEDLVTKCQSLKAEPFGLANVAARQFLTVAAWKDYGWREQFPRAEVRVRVEVWS